MEARRRILLENLTEANYQEKVLNVHNLKADGKGSLIISGHTASLTRKMEVQNLSIASNSYDKYYLATQIPQPLYQEYNINN